MIKPDIVVAWPRNCDYPLWRQFIHDNRERFNLVIIVFTETNQGDDYREFVRSAMAKDWVLFADSPIVGGGQDWRNVAVNHALVQSYNAQWVLFMEEDFEVKKGFWSELDAYEELGVRAIGVKDSKRLHPCCLLLRRDLLGELDKNFGIVKDTLDHFGLIQKQLEAKEEPIAVFTEKVYYHMNGLSHNMSLVNSGQMPVYKPEEFNDYLKKCLKVTVPMDDRFTAWVKAYFERAGIPAE